MSYDLGDTVSLGVTVVDDAGTPINAATVTLTITRPDGTTVAGTNPTNPAVGRYKYDFVPTAVGLHQELWETTSPATSFGPNAIDVRPRTRGVVSLVDLRDYLNKAVAGSAANADEDELRDMLAAGVERVERHLGRGLAPDGQVTQSEVLAVKMAAAEFWRTQRAPRGGVGVGGGLTGTAVELDSGPAGIAPLAVRLAELLGPAVSGRGAVLPPSGSFPAAQDWPDPICL